MIFLIRNILYSNGTVTPRHVALVFTVLFLFPAAFGQASSDLPNKIRGYKVHKKIIEVSHSKTRPDDDYSASINFTEPDLIDISLTGITFAVSAEILALEQSGTVDRLMFHDLRVNDIPVTIEDFSSPFSFRKRETVKLPKPARIFLPTGRMLQAAFKEMRDSKETWTVRGRIFVFGKFRKFGFSHKRVIPVDIDLLVANPLKGGGKTTPGV